MNVFTKLLPGLCLLLLSSCIMGELVPERETVYDNPSGETQLQSRQMQSRTFETGDKEKMLTAIVHTLQDLEYQLVSVSSEVGTVQAYRQNDGLRVTMTITVKNGTRIAVRAYADQRGARVRDTQYYQQLFQALSQSLFLEALPI